MTAISGMPTRPLYDSTDSLLRFAMRADATLTGLCGLAAAFVADPLSSLTGLTSIQEYSLGAFFVLYGRWCLHCGVRGTAVPGCATPGRVASRRAGAGHLRTMFVAGAPVSALQLAQAEPVDGVVGVLAQHQGGARTGGQNVLDQIRPVDRSPDLACGGDGLGVVQGRVVVEV
jgi:hypothetical protein